MSAASVTPQKSLGHLVSGGAATRFMLMEKLTPEYPSDALAEALEVSESGFAAHRREAWRARRRRDAQLRPLIAESFEASRRTHGCPWVRLDLQRTAASAAAKIASPGSWAWKVCGLEAEAPLSAPHHRGPSRPSRR